VVPWGHAYGRTPPREESGKWTPPKCSQESTRSARRPLGAGWSPSVGNGWAAVFASPEDEDLTLRAYASFFEAGVAPAFLIVETLDGDPARAPLGLQVWVGTRIPSPEEAGALLDEHGVVCRVGDLMPEDLTVEAQ
jgi:hypothetical protein